MRGLELVVAAQVVFAQADVGQHAAHEVDVDRRPDVRSADDGRLRDAPAEVVDRAVVDPRTRLERLGGRAPVRREVGVAVAGDLRAAIVHDAGDELVPALDRGSAPDVHDDGIVLTGHTSTVVPVSLVSKSSGRWHETRRPPTACGCGHSRGADVHAERAARIEAAPFGRLDRARHVALEHLHRPALLGVGRRRAAQQGDGVRMARGREDLRGGTLLDDAPEVHHRERVRHGLDDGEVVGDEQIGEAEAPLEVVQQHEDARLDGDVERGGRLVEHDELGVQRQGPRDGDALALAAAELVRAAPQVLRPQADHLQQREDAVLQLPAAQVRLRAERLGDEVVDGHARVQRRVGVLEHHLGVAHHLAALARAEAGEVLVEEPDGARGRLDQLQDGAGGRRLAAPRLAHQRQRLALGRSRTRRRPRRARCRSTSCPDRGGCGSGP